MFKIEVTFDRTVWKPEQMESVRRDLIEGMSFADIIEKYDDFGLCDAAAVICAMDLGWNMKEFIDDEIMETLNNYFYFDDETTESLNKLIVNEALNHIEEQTTVA